jgi:hypothetical protein
MGLEARRLEKVFARRPALRFTENLVLRGEVATEGVTMVLDRMWIFSLRNIARRTSFSLMNKGPCTAAWVAGFAGIPRPAAGCSLSLSIRCAEFNGNRRAAVSAAITDGSRGSLATDAAVAPTLVSLLEMPRSAITRYNLTNPLTISAPKWVGASVSVNVGRDGSKDQRPARTAPTQCGRA